MNQLDAVCAALQTIHTFAWKKGARSRYWLPKGKEDVPRNRMYGKRGEAAAARAGEKPQAGAPETAEPKPAAPPSAADDEAEYASRVRAARADAAANRAAFDKRQKAGELPGAEFTPGVNYQAPTGAMRSPLAPPVEPPKNLPPGVPPPPPPPIEQMGTVNAIAARDKSRFGAKIAEFLRGAAAYALGMLTAANGAAWGAVAGLAVGGPLGLAVGTALGGGLGARAGGAVARKGYSVLGGANRARATVRNVARSVAPLAAATATAPVAAAGLGASSAALGTMASTGLIVPDAVAGYPVTGAALDLGQAALEIPGNVAKGVRNAMATSRVSERRARRTNRDQMFAEAPPAPKPPAKPAPKPADGKAPPNLDPVALLTARIRAITKKEPDQKLVLAALGMAALRANETDGASAAAFSEWVAFAWKKGARAQYWLPDGKEDVPRNRLYGKRARAAAERSDKAGRVAGLTAGLTNTAAAAAAPPEAAAPEGELTFDKIEDALVRYNSLPRSVRMAMAGAKPSKRPPAAGAVFPKPLLPETPPPAPAPPAAPAPTPAASKAERERAPKQSFLRKLAFELLPKIKALPSMLPGLAGTAALGALGALGGTPAQIMLGSIGAGGLLNKAMDRGSKAAKRARLAMARTAGERRLARLRNKQVYFSELTAAVQALSVFAWKQGTRKRYWLPEGKEDVPGNRVYGKRAEAAAKAAETDAAGKSRVGRISPEARAQRDAARAKPKPEPVLVDRVADPGSAVRAPTEPVLVGQQSGGTRARAAVAAKGPVPPPARGTFATTREAARTVPEYPEVARPTPLRTVTIAAETINGTKNTRAKVFALPGYRGPEIALAEYKTPRGTGYRAFLAATGTPIADGNGVSSVEETLKNAVASVARLAGRNGIDPLDLPHYFQVARALQAGRTVTEAATADYPGIRERYPARPRPQRPGSAAVTPQRLDAMKKRVEAGIVSTRALNWGYDFQKARAALSDSARRIDAYVAKSPRAAIELAKSVTGATPTDAADAAKLLKAWVGESLDLLAGEPGKDKPRRGRSFSERLDRARWLPAAHRVWLTAAQFCAAIDGP